MTDQSNEAHGSADSAAGSAAAGSAGSAPGSAAMTEADRLAIAAQLGRMPRGASAVAHRCGCGLPDVVQTPPRLPDGSPFPTTFYLTCPKATAECSRLESAGLMRQLNERLAVDEDLAGRYRSAHRDYLARRAALGEVPEIAGISAGGMPERVKCLHVHLAHALAAGRGVNPVGDEVLDLIEPSPGHGRCVEVPADPQTAAC